MLYARYVPPKIWDEALKYSNQIHNKYIKDQTPFEAWSGRKLEFSKFQIFGSCAWAHVHSKKSKVLDPYIIA
jgi:hypothetical protein